MEQSLIRFNSVGTWLSADFCRRFKLDWILNKRQILFLLASKPSIKHWTLESSSHRWNGEMRVEQSLPSISPNVGANEHSIADNNQRFGTLLQIVVQHVLRVSGNDWNLCDGPSINSSNSVFVPLPPPSHLHHQDCTTDHHSIDG